MYENLPDDEWEARLRRALGMVDDFTTILLARDRVDLVRSARQVNQERRQFHRSRYLSGTRKANHDD